MKKITLSLLTPLLLITPVTTALSCSSNNDVDNPSYIGKKHNIANEHIVSTTETINTSEVKTINLTKTIMTQAEVQAFNDGLGELEVKFTADVAKANGNKDLILKLLNTYVDEVFVRGFKLRANYSSYANELLANSKFIEEIKTAQILKLTNTVAINVADFPGKNNIKEILEDKNFDVNWDVNWESSESEADVWSYKTAIEDKTFKMFNPSQEVAFEGYEEYFDKLNWTNDKFIKHFTAAGIKSVESFNLQFILSSVTQY